jgi:hypothetical protein
METVLRRRGRTAPTKETLDGIHDFVVRRTSAIADGGLRIKWANLTEDEIGEVVALTREAQEGDDGFKLERLGSKKAARWEKIVGKGAGAPDFFANYRAAEEIRAIAAEATRLSVRRPIRRREELGLFDEFVNQLTATPPNLFADHAAVGLLVFAQMHAGTAFAARSRVERDADGTPVLVINTSYGLFGDRDPEGRFANWPDALKQLEANAWFRVERHGPEWKIRPGARATRAMAGGAATKKAAA